MRRILSIVLVIGLAFFGYKRYKESREENLRLRAEAAAEVEVEAAAEATPVPYTEPWPEFHCDGRVHCSEMSSCEEAKYFLDNCPGVKMDGDNDRFPCERGPC